MAQFCIGGSAGFPSFDGLWPSFSSIFSVTPPEFPDPPFDLKTLHLSISGPRLSIPQLPDLLTWKNDPSFSMPLLDMLSWLGELIGNFLVNLIGMILDPIQSLLGAISLPPMPCPSGFDFTDIVNGNYEQIKAAVATSNCLPIFDFINGIIMSVKNGVALTGALIADLISLTANFIPMLLQQLLDYFDSIEIPGLPSLPEFPEIPSLSTILGSLPELSLPGLRTYLASFSFSVPGLPDFDFSLLIPDPLIPSPLEPLATIEAIKIFLYKMSNLLLEAIAIFWNELSDIVGGLIPLIEIPELCFEVSLGPEGPPF